MLSNLILLVMLDRQYVSYIDYKSPMPIAKCIHAGNPEDDVRCIIMVRGVKDSMDRNCRWLTFLREQPGEKLTLSGAAMLLLAAAALLQTA